MNTLSKWRLARRAALALVGAGIATAALAHHGWSSYDEKRELSLTGTIRQAGWEQPHSFIRLEVKGEPARTWHVILAPPSRLASRGLARETLAPGVTATVVGYPHRSEPDELRAERITVAGKTTELR